MIQEDLPEWPDRDKVVWADVWPQTVIVLVNVGVGTIPSRMPLMDREWLERLAATILRGHDHGR